MCKTAVVGFLKYSMYTLSCINKMLSQPWNTKIHLVKLMTIFWPYFYRQIDGDHKLNHTDSLYMVVLMGTPR